jgi:hypothetical protein
LGGRFRTDNITGFQGQQFPSGDCWPFCVSWHRGLIVAKATERQFVCVTKDGSFRRLDIATAQYPRFEKDILRVGDEVQMDNDGHPMSNGKVTLVKKVASFFGCQVNWDKDPSDNDLYAPDQLELID